MLVFFYDLDFFCYLFFLFFFLTATGFNLEASSLTWLPKRGSTSWIIWSWCVMNNSFFFPENLENIEWYHGYEESNKSKGGVPWCELQRKESGRKVMVAYTSLVNGSRFCTARVYNTPSISKRAPRDGLFLLSSSSSAVLNNNTSSSFPLSFCFIIF